MAQSQFVLNRKPTYIQEEAYQELRDLSRFYQNLTEDIVRAKNRLHKVLQVTFPELENLLSTPTGEQYWNLVTAFPCKYMVLELSSDELSNVIRNSTSKRISNKRVTYLADKLTELAHKSYCAVKKTSPMIEEVRYYAQELLRLSERRQVVLDNMVDLAQPLPEYDILLSIPGIAETTAISLIGELGDIRWFQSANQMNAFIGIDLRHYESGNFLAKEHITKRGNPYARKILFKCIHNIASASHTNPCHIADFYEKRKRQSQVTSTKPHTIASIHRLIRTMYYLITHNKLYDYASTQKSIKLVMPYYSNTLCLKRLDKVLFFCVLLSLLSSEKKGTITDIWLLYSRWFCFKPLAHLTNGRKKLTQMNSLSVFVKSILQ
ncbi:transposase [Streptococcus moroccensis]|uniref:Transposase n=1 Tax=Streptococcus moroccensis TaxID=1451356 RepID=A0ABT9YVI1_9STRE|nr:transposase [Streptococcus moroccensis]